MILVLLSCREGIIAPGTFVENINEPVQIREGNSYTFLLNADSFSMDLTVFLSINSSTSRINITLVDYKSGYAKVTLRDGEEIIRYSFLVDEDVDFYSELLDGYVPSTANIKTENFSGKIKIQLRKSL